MREMTVDVGTYKVQITARSEVATVVVCSLVQRVSGAQKDRYLLQMGESSFLPTLGFRRH